MSFRGQTPEDDAFRQMDMAFDAGITLFDTAENYPTPLKEESQGDHGRDARPHDGCPSGPLNAQGWEAKMAEYQTVG